MARDDRNKKQAAALAHFSGALEAVRDMTDEGEKNLDKETVDYIVDMFNNSLDQNDAPDNVVRIE